ncbi:MAG: glycosyltransferase family 4 protein [Acidobacteriota bacterium]
MRVVCPVISGSGVLVFHQRLASRLVSESVETSILEFSPWSEYWPWLLPGRFERQLHGNPAPELIHTNADYGVFFRRSPVPLVVTIHHSSVDLEAVSQLNWFVSLHHRTLLRSFLRRTLEAANRIVAVSEHSREILNRIFDGRWSVPVIYNGIDENRFCPTVTDHLANPHPVVTLFFSGNPSRRKGFDLLGSLLASLGRDYRLRYTSGLRDEQAVLLGDNVECLGRLDEDQLIREINGADIVVQPSRREGFGLSILEAMACGKPVVSTNCSAIPELIDHGKGGFLCEPGSVSQLVEAVRKLAQSPQLRIQLGQYNRQKVLRQFTLTRMAREYSEVYRSVLDQVS